MQLYPTGLTLKQRALIARIKRDFGGRVNIVMADNMANVEFINNARHPSSGKIQGVINADGSCVLFLVRGGQYEPMNVLPSI